MMPADDEERYGRVLREFEAFTRETQAYRARTEQALADINIRTMNALAEMNTKLTTYWAATASTTRQLSNWLDETERAARIERANERIKRDTREKWIIGLLLVVLLSVGILLWVLR